MEEPLSFYRLPRQHPKNWKRKSDATWTLLWPPSTGWTRSPAVTRCLSAPCWPRWAPTWHSSPLPSTCAVGLASVRAIKRVPAEGKGAHPARESLVTRALASEGVGGRPHQRHVFLGPVPALAPTPRRKTSTLGGGSFLADGDLAPAQTRDGISGVGSRLLRPPDQAAASGTSGHCSAGTTGLCRDAPEENRGTSLSRERSSLEFGLSGGCLSN